MPYIQHKQWWNIVQHTIWLFTISSVYSLSFVTSYTSLSQNTDVHWHTSCLHASTQECKYQVHVEFAPVTSRGKQSAAMATLGCSSHACNKRTIQSPLSSSTHRGIFWELVTFYMLNELQRATTNTLITNNNNNLNICIIINNARGSNACLRTYKRC